MAKRDGNAKRGAAPAAKAAAENPSGLHVELVLLESLTPHPRNYRIHPDDQLEHIIKSIRENGFYRNVVVARDGTILAGHGVVQAAQKIKLKVVPVIRLDIGPDEPRALKLLAGDNEISRLAEIDDRALTEMLKEIKLADPDGLLRTGFDDAMLANLLMVTRPASEMQDFDAAAHWVGMPEYDAGEQIACQMIVSFQAKEDFEAFAKKLGIDQEIRKKRMAMWFPARERDDANSLRFEA